MNKLEDITALLPRVHGGLSLRGAFLITGAIATVPGLAQIGAAIVERNKPAAPETLGR